MNNKVALVIEGGAMRGAFLKGVLDCFKENEIKFPYIVGVSAGAITGFEFFSGIEFDVNKLFQEFFTRISFLFSIIFCTSLLICYLYNTIFR